MKKDRLLKLFLIVVLLVTSIVTYSCYGKDKEEVTSLDFYSQKEEISRMYMEQAILMDMKIQRRKGNYDYFHYYVSGDNIDNYYVSGDYIDSVDSEDKYSLVKAFDDLLDEWEDSNSYWLEGVDYYAYDLTNEMISFSNDNDNLRKDIEVDNKSNLEKYQWIISLSFDENGIVRVEGNGASKWENVFYNLTFDQMFKDSYEDIFDLNTFSINNPKNMKIYFAVNKNLPDTCHLIGLLNEGYSISESLIIYVVFVLILIGLIVLFIPINKLKNIEPFMTIKRIKTLFLFISYVLIAMIWIYMMKVIINCTYNGELAYLLRQEGFSGTVVALVPMINVGGWLVFYSMALYFIYYVKLLFVDGIKKFIIENTFIYSIYNYFKKKMYEVVKLDLASKKNSIIKKIVFISSVLISCLLLVIGVVLEFIYRYSFSFVYYCLICFLLMIIFSIMFTLFIKKNIDNIVNDYDTLLEFSGNLAAGEFNNKMEDNLGLFNALKNELNCINDGFKDAVSKEVASQKMKTELISNVSHDLKTPLTSIMSYIDLLKQPNLSKDETNEYITILDKNTKRLKTLIEDLFEVSKVNSGNIQLNPINLNIYSLIQQVLLEYQEQFDDHNLQIKLNTNSDNIICNLDSEKTYRILENLCQNIYKYALENTRIYIDIEANEDNVSVIFKNISANEIKQDGNQLTERFIQGDESRKSEGSGLGLAICKSFVEVQDGKFNVSVDGDLFKAEILLPRNYK